MGARAIECASTEQLDQARVLFAEYARGLPHNPCFVSFDKEIAGLPGRYAPPGGRLLLAVDGVEAVGCGALREITAEVASWRARAGLPPLAGRTGEMKRLFVRPGVQGRGVGRMLCERLIAEARGAGYTRLWLDSEPEMVAAHGLYRSLGFRQIERYNDDPLPQMAYLGLELSAAVGATSRGDPVRP